MKEYLVLFRPLEPYFFGNDKLFAFSGEEKGRYFISSEDTPSQSSVLGVLRYMLLPYKKTDWSYTDDEKKINEEAVGKKGFDPEEKDPDYGKIDSISPVFIYGDGHILVKTPFDHNINSDKYTPFSEYYEIPAVPGGGKKCYAGEYDPKEGNADSYMKLSCGDIVSGGEIFRSDLRVGINRGASEGGFFKKEYKLLLGNYSFAVYLRVKDDIAPEDGIVHMGQGKSTFMVTFTEQKNTLEEQMRAFLREDIVYCASDVFVGSDIYRYASFAVTGLKTYRHFSKDGRYVKKGNTLYNIIKAGSVFKTDNIKDFIAKAANAQVSRAGYNIFVYRKEEE